ncbi:hypothetical protein ABKW28_21435 [Nocardioides sp. 31GB23]|uniref:hypothetical protein n=1 Tax=Nocardioides TaxID=1839 RepID=UPI001CD02A15|nr:hypothetical protein [Nocardioides lacusdianchii]
MTTKSEKNQSSEHEQHKKHVGFMWGMMYKNVKVNVAIIVAALVVGGSALWLSRSQTFVQDES